MNEDVTLRELASPAFVGVAESDSLRSTVRLLAEEGAERAVVLRGSEPVGSVTPGAVFRALADGADPESTTVDAVMDPAPPAVAGAERPPAAAAVLATGASQVLITGEDGLAGTVTARDLVAASTGGELAGIAAPDGEGPLATADEVDAGPYAGGEAAEATAAPGGTPPEQGICEECGSFARGLAVTDGGLRCPDCRDT